MPVFEGTNYKRNRQGNTGAPTSRSTAVQSYSSGSFWTEEEARLYERWAGYSDNYKNSQTNPYFDYFFSGQDIKVKIDGLEDKDFMPIYSFGYAIQQEKMPVYGFASYTYDAMLRGVRIINGAFSLVVTEPFLLQKHIARSASLRAKTTQNKATSHALRLLDGELANVERYWRRNYDSNLDEEQKHLFSIHPPFNFLIKYGIQDVSAIGPNPLMQERLQELRQDFYSNGTVWTDTNERLYDTAGSQSSRQGINNGGRILLENIEITGKSIEYDPSGDPVLETYTFLARDERIQPDPDIINGNTTRYPQTGATGGNASSSSPERDGYIR